MTLTKQLFLNGSALFILSTSICVQATNSFNAKHIGQGFTSLTSDFTAAINNPALANTYDANDDFYFSLGVGLLATDDADVIDTGELISDDIDILSDDIDDLAFDSQTTLIDVANSQLSLLVQANNITDNLTLIDEQPVTARIGTNALVMIPNKYVNLGVFVEQYARLAVTVDYDDTDTILLNAAIITLNSNLLDNLSSSGEGLGYSVIEGGLIIAKNIIDNRSFSLNLGTKIKSQRIDIISTSVDINDFDDDEFDLDDDIADSNQANIDLGLYANWGENKQWHFALVGNNLLSHDLDFINDNETVNFELEANAQAAISYGHSWYRFSAEIDLLDREGFANLEESQYIALGAQFSLGEHAQLRVGARTDINNVDEDVFTFGLGLSPWDIIALDISALKGQDDTLGFALQLGIKL